MDDLDRALEQRILELLAQRDTGRTICPSDAARSVHSERSRHAEDGWRALMEPARQAARRLVDAGRLEVTQGGKVVDPGTATGPIRLRLPQLRRDT